jgi:hypothetical protein
LLKIQVVWCTCTELPPGKAVSAALLIGVVTNPDGDRFQGLPVNKNKANFVAIEATAQWKMASIPA